MTGIHTSHFSVTERDLPYLCKVIAPMPSRLCLPVILSPVRFSGQEWGSIRCLMFRYVY